MSVHQQHKMRHAEFLAAAAFLSGRVGAAALWNPWINKIRSSGKAHALFTSKEIPELIPDLLAAQQKSLAAHRKDFLGTVQAWFGTGFARQDEAGINGRALS